MIQTLLLLLGLVLGALLYLAFNLNKAFPRRDFEWKKFIRKNLFSTVVNLLVGVIFIFAKDDLATVYPVTKISIAMVGFGGGALWHFVFGVFSKERPTAVGLK